MSADTTRAIGPVSVRYAAQIRELLHVQAVQRMAADQEAARARADAARVKAAETPAEPDRVQAKVEAPEATALPAPTKLPETKTETPGRLVDIQA